MLFAVPEHPGLVQYQIWFLFVKGLVSYNIFKSLIPKSLVCHLNSIYIQSRTMQQSRSYIQNSAATNLYGCCNNVSV